MFPRLPFAGLFICALAAAQTLSFGVVGGASATPDFNRSFSTVPPPGPPIVLTDYSSPERFIIGGMLEFQLPKDWSIEVDGLYHPLRFDSAAILPNGTLNSVSPSPVITFEFPALAKYRFRWRGWRPFLEAGPSFRTAGNLNGSSPSHYGVAAGAGAETRLGKFRIAPEVRYIRWAEDNSSGARTRSDQIELLTSFSTGAFEGGRAFSSRVSLGVVAGVTLSPDFRSFQGTGDTFNGNPSFFSFSSSPGAFLAGAMVEVALARGFFFEGDAIHQPMHFTSTINTWTFPVLGKYKFPTTHRMRPFLEAGPAFRLATELTGSSPYGVTAGAGIETRVWRLAIAPAVRYTHWDRNSFNFPDFVPFQNQVEALAGFSF
jgi:hypothetical protein